MNQAQSYANALKYSESFIGAYKIVAYVVGNTVESKWNIILVHLILIYMPVHTIN